jgi:hypothetical protein
VSQSEQKSAVVSFMILPAEELIVGTVELIAVILYFLGVLH